MPYFTCPEAPLTGRRKADMIRVVVAGTGELVNGLPRAKVKARAELPASWAAAHKLTEEGTSGIPQTSVFA